MDFQVIIQVAKKDLRPTIPENTPLAMSQLISMMWEKAPEQRPDTQYLLDIVKKLESYYLANKEEWDACRGPNGKPVKESESADKVLFSGSTSSEEKPKAVNVTLKRVVSNEKKKPASPKKTPRTKSAVYKPNRTGTDEDGIKESKEENSNQSKERNKKSKNSGEKDLSDNEKKLADSSDSSRSTGKSEGESTKTVKKNSDGKKTTLESPRDKYKRTPESPRYKKGQNEHDKKSVITRSRRDSENADSVDRSQSRKEGQSSNATHRATKELSVSSGSINEKHKSIDRRRISKRHREKSIDKSGTPDETGDRHNHRLTGIHPEGRISRMRSKSNTSPSPGKPNI